MSSIHSLHAQRGVALLVGLLMLLILTILGVSIMNSTTLELRMAGNAQNKNQATQAAEALIDSVVANNAAAFINNIDPTPIADAFTIEPPNVPVGVSASAVQVYDQHHHCILEKAATDIGNGGFTCRYHHIDVTGSHASSGASAFQVQGVFVITAVAPTELVVD